jgi:hypothetical protein
MTQVLAEEDACGAGVERYARVLDPWLEPMLARLVELAAVGPGGRVLDLATGTGRGRPPRRTAGRLRRRHRRLARDDRVRTPALAAPDPLQVAEAEWLPFDAGAFTLVTCRLALSQFGRACPGAAHGDQDGDPGELEEHIAAVVAESHAGDEDGEREGAGPPTGCREKRQWGAINDQEDAWQRFRRRPGAGLSDRLQRWLEAVVSAAARRA